MARGPRHGQIARPVVPSGYTAVPATAPPLRPVDGGYPHMPTSPAWRLAGFPAQPPATPADGIDPRPDLLEDALLWRRLLAIALHLAGDRPDGIYGVLRGMRCCGAKLELRPGDTTVRLRPRIDPTGRLTAWRDEAAWRWDREEWLVPHTATLHRLLEVLASPALAGEASHMHEAAAENERQCGSGSGQPPEAAVAQAV